LTYKLLRICRTLTAYSLLYDKSTQRRSGDWAKPHALCTAA